MAEIKIQDLNSAQQTQVRDGIGALKNDAATVQTLLGGANAGNTRSAIGAVENTNSAINTVLAENPVNVRTTINAELAGKVAPQVIENFYALNGTFSAFQELDYAIKGSPAYVGVTGFSDSMAVVGFSYGYLVMDLIDRWGLGAVCSPNLGGPNRVGAAWTFTGGAKKQNESGVDYSYTPGGNWLYMPAGSTASYTQSISDITFSSTDVDSYAKRKRNTKHHSFPSGVSKVSVFYVKEVGAGSLTMTLSQTQVADQTATVNCNDTYGLGRQDFTPHDFVRKMTVNLSTSGGTVIVVGVVFFGADGGVIAWDSAWYGATMTQQLASLSGNQFKAAYAAFFKALNTSFVFHNQRVPGDANWQANYPIFFSAFKTLNDGKVGQLVLAEPPVDPANNPDIETINTFLRSQCRTSKVAFMDTSMLVGSYSDLNTLGWDKAYTDAITGNPVLDGIHLGGAFHRYIAGIVWNATGGFSSAQSVGTEFNRTRPFMRTSVGAMRDKIVLDAVSRNYQLSSGFTPTLSTASGTGYSVTTDNLRGSVLNLGNTNGHAAALLVPITGSSSLVTVGKSFCVTFRGYRNVNLDVGHRAAIIIGGPSTQVTNISAIAARCFGVEIARRETLAGVSLDIDSNLVTHVYRLFYHTGSSLLYSAWCGFPEASFGGSSLWGVSISVLWDAVLKRLFLYISPNNVADTEQAASHLALASIGATELTDNPPGVTTGPWVHSIAYTDGVNTPGPTGTFNFSINQISAMSGAYDRLVSSKF